MGESEVRPFRRRAHIAVFEATSLNAKGLKEHLAARSFPAASVRLFTSSDDPDANLTEYAGEAMLVTRPDLETLGRLDIAFLCGRAAEAAAYLDWPLRAGFTAIDLTAAAGPGAPLVNVAVNPEAVVRGPGVIAAPGPIPHLLSSLLAPIRRGPGLREAVAVVFQPASEWGDRGIEELYQQTLGLLNFKDLPREVFGDQLAFNLIPGFLAGAAAATDGAGPDRAAADVVRITGAGYDLSVHTVLAPVFHCHAALLRITLDAGRDRGDLARALQTGEGVALAAGGERATPVGWAGRAGILVDGIRPAGGTAFWVWAVGDNLAGGSALNAVRIAETLVGRSPERSHG
jgi:aspartate-semialdehyde dehydrogenase